MLSWSLVDLHLFFAIDSYCWFLNCYDFIYVYFFFFFSSRRRHTRYWRDWSSDVCSSDLETGLPGDDAVLVGVDRRRGHLQRRRLALQRQRAPLHVQVRIPLEDLVGAGLAVRPHGERAAEGDHLADGVGRPAGEVAGEDAAQALPDQAGRP